ncbi:MAG: alpha/beta hydrolase, partial [Clostridiales bacterium]|nr:alpha/beta hydrolase [Clostridiales bacterium]
PDSMNYSMDEVADSILAFCDALGLQKTHMIGFSLGAVYALYAAAKQPERFAKVIAIAPGGVTAQMPKKMRKMERSPFGALVRESYSQKHVARALASCYYDATLCDKTVAEQYFETLDDFRSRQALHYSLRNFDLPLAQKAFLETPREVLLLWGDADRWRPMENMEETQAFLPQSIPYIIRNGGHLMHEEKADAIVEVISKYLTYQVESPC